MTTSSMALLSSGLPLRSLRRRGNSRPRKQRDIRCRGCRRGGGHNRAKRLEGTGGRQNEIQRRGGRRRWWRWRKSIRGGGCRQGKTNNTAFSHNSSRWAANGPIMAVAVGNGRSANTGGSGVSTEEGCQPWPVLDNRPRLSFLLFIGWSRAS